MTKELSKQLCELCGIEPEIYANWCNEVGSYDCGNCSKGYGSVCAENCTKCEYYEKEHETYPDFGQPENFVKLLELDLSKSNLFDEDYSMLEALIQLFDFLGVKNRKDILEQILEELSDETGHFYGEYNLLEFTKQTIREAEWKYE